MNNSSSPLVSIRCITYNHEKYIRDALEGFVMQKTNFKFEAIVHDDASTDNTAAIIREYAEKYPDIIKPIFETENQYSKHDGSLARIMNAACKGKYFAFCEGDDYWTDPYKLQKQVDFMENHQECSLTYHACKNIFVNRNETSHRLFGENVLNSYSSIDILKDYFHTATILVRREVLYSELYSKVIKLGCQSGDTLLYLTASRLGEIKGTNEKMSVYRRHLNGASQKLNSYKTIYKDYRIWVSIANIFKGDIKKWLEKNKLKMYIASPFIIKDFNLSFKLIRYGITNSPKSVLYAILYLIGFYIKRIHERLSKCYFKDYKKQ